MVLTNTQVSKHCKAFANGSSANIKLLKSQLHKRGQSGGFQGRLLGPLLKTGLALIDNALKPLAKSVLISLGSTAAASAKDVFSTTTLIVSTEEMNDIMKISRIRFINKRR